MKFPNTERFWQLHELENNYRSLSASASLKAKWFSDKKAMAVEMARSRAFWGAANLVADLINKNDRRI